MSAAITTVGILESGAFTIITICNFLCFAELLDKLPEVNCDWNDVSQYLLEYEYTAPEGRTRQIAKKIRQFYFDDQEIDSSTFQILTKVITKW